MNTISSAGVIVRGSSIVADQLAQDGCERRVDVGVAVDDFSRRQYVESSKCIEGKPQHRHRVIKRLRRIE
jgi:hypothetical protein